MNLPAFPASADFGWATVSANAAAATSATFLKRNMINPHTYSCQRQVTHRERWASVHELKLNMLSHIVPCPRSMPHARRWGSSTSTNKKAAPKDRSCSVVVCLGYAAAVRFLRQPIPTVHGYYAKSVLPIVRRTAYV